KDFLAKHPREGDFLGFEGMKAYAANRRGDFKTAFNTLENLTRNFPHTIFAEAWGIGWLTDDAIRAAGQHLSLQFLISTVSKRYREADRVSDWGRTHPNRAIAALERVEAVTGPNDIGVVFKGQMLSRAGRFAEAIAMAEREAERNPNFRTATAAGMAHKRNG